MRPRPSYAAVRSAGPRVAAMAAVVGLLAMAGCGKHGAQRQAPASQPVLAEATTRVTEAGPVKATVSLGPQDPEVGDPLTLRLTVVAEPGVEVELPAFGEALGRFSISSYTPRERVTKGGGREASQEYRLQAPMSGKHRIPPLRLTFVDRRPGHAPDGGAPEPQELLTEELTVTVKSVLPKGAVAATLRPARGALPETVGGELLLRLWPWLLGALLIIAAVVVVLVLRRRAQGRVRLTAYDKAMRRLEALERRGLPSPQEADHWYVELSAIVRRYLEDRFAVRAPELTTEEFLHVAQRSRELTADDRALLGEFLEGCDRVKFAAYQPEATESHEALTAARNFITQTRLLPDAAPANAAAAGAGEAA